MPTSADRRHGPPKASVAVASEALTSVPVKRYVGNREGTHTAIMEKNRMQPFQAVQQFLDEQWVRAQ